MLSIYIYMLFIVWTGIYIHVYTYMYACMYAYVRVGVPVMYSCTPYYGCGSFLCHSA